MILLLITTTTILEEKCQKLLSAYDHITLTCVHSVDDALNTVAWDDVTLVVLAQEGEGTHACKRLHEAKPHHPIIPIISTIGERDALLEAGAADILISPLSPIALETRLAPYLAQSSIHSEKNRTEKLAVMGRLSAGLIHEISNPMQGIKGAMILALEELNDPVSLKEYMELAIEQADRVTKLIARVHKINQLDNDEQDEIVLDRLLEEVDPLIRKEMEWKKLRLNKHLAPSLPTIWGSASQLRFLFMNIIFSICDLSEERGGELSLHTMSAGEMVRVEFRTAVLSTTPLQKLNGKLALSYSTALTHNGRLTSIKQKEQTIIRIEFPIHREPSP